MTGMDLMKLFGEAKETYVMEAQRLRSGEKSQSVRRFRARRLWVLAAAVIALLALSITAYAVVSSRIQMQLVVHQPETEPPQSEVDLLNTYYPQQLPEGYRCIGGEVNPGVTGNIRYITYYNDAGQTITYDLSVRVDFSQDIKALVRSPIEQADVDVQGQPGCRFRGSNGVQVLTWKNQELGYYACIWTEDAQADILSMARSVGAGEPLPERFLYHNGAYWDAWYPQSVPEGYAPTEVIQMSNGVLHVAYWNEKEDNIGDYIDFYISIGEDLSDIGEAPHSRMIWEDAQVAGSSARRLHIEGGQYFLFWKNEAEGFNAELVTEDPNVDLIAMAESVGPGEKLELTDPSELYQKPDYSIKVEQDQTAHVGYEPWYPQEIPQGYEMTFVGNRAYGMQHIDDKNAQGDSLLYTFTYRVGPTGLRGDGMGQVEEVDVGGHTAYYSHGENWQSITWADEERGFAFSLNGGPDVDLVAVARSVALGPELTPSDDEMTAKALEQLGDYRVTALPEGMAEDGLSGWPLEGEDDWYSYVRRWYYGTTDSRLISMEYSTYVTEAETEQEAANLFVSGAAEYGAQAVRINGCTGAATEYDGHASVAWLMGSAQKGIAFTLYSDDFTAEELIEIAQSVKKQ